MEPSTCPRLILLVFALPTATLADERPMPPSAQAEISFAVAAIGLVLALGVVQWLVMHR